MVLLVEKTAATVAEATFHLWISAVVEGKRLVKSHLMGDKLVSRPDRFAPPFIHSFIRLTYYIQQLICDDEPVLHCVHMCAC